MNDQERAWAGEFGNAYNARSPGDEEANYHFFKQALWPDGEVEVQPRSILELGAGTGANLWALHRLYPNAQMGAVEINHDACIKLTGVPKLMHLANSSITDYHPEHPWHLVLTKGLLIHIPPDELRIAYETIHRAALRWILLAEYYNPTPQMIPYRGQDDRLWKRDFAGEMLDRYPDLRLVDYGFTYHRDVHPQDDITWFLMEKQ